MNILLATDGSEYSDSAARFLTRFNWSREDAVTALHVIYAIPFSSDEQFHYRTLKAVKKEIAPRVLDSTVALLKPVQAKISVEIEEGEPNQDTPEQCIMNVADRSGADLIVMGARGLKGIGSVFIGSVTRLVASRASKPVLVVKPSAGGAAGPLKVLFATDGSDSSLATAELLSSLPFPRDAQVTIMNVISSSFTDIPEQFALEVNDRIKEVVAVNRASEFTQSEEIISRTRSQLSGKFRDIQSLSRVGDPPTEILKAAEDRGADIIAVGCRGVRGVKGIMGSVSKNVLTHSKGSILIGKTGKQ